MGDIYPHPGSGWRPGQFRRSRPATPLTSAGSRPGERSRSAGRPQDFAGALDALKPRPDGQAAHRAAWRPKNNKQKKRDRRHVSCPQTKEKRYMKTQELDASDHGAPARGPRRQRGRHDRRDDDRQLGWCLSGQPGQRLQQNPLRRDEPRTSTSPGTKSSPEGPWRACGPCSRPTYLTWDLVRRGWPPTPSRPYERGSCDGGRPRRILAESDDGTPASEDYRRSESCPTASFPQIVYSTTNGYSGPTWREWEGRHARGFCAIFYPRELPPVPARWNGVRSKQHGMGASVRRRRYMEDIYDVLRNARAVRACLRPIARHHQREIPLWSTSAAEAVQYLADGEAVIGSTYNGRHVPRAIVELGPQPIECCGTRRVSDIDGWIIPEGVSD